LDGDTLKLLYPSASSGVSIQLLSDVEYVHTLVVSLHFVDTGIVAHSPQAARVGITGHEQLAVSQEALIIGISVEMMPLYTAALVERTGARSVAQLDNLCNRWCLLCKTGGTYYRENPGELNLVSNTPWIMAGQGNVR